jgi:ATP-dependent helicase HrpB
LQDFFGLKETPRVARGQVPIVLHLLAPNQRPVQMTSDLAGFWQRLYPQVRRELSRRYPRHKWPENPLFRRAIFQRGFSQFVAPQVLFPGRRLR